MLCKHRVVTVLTRNPHQVRSPKPRNGNWLKVKWGPEQKSDAPVLLSPSQTTAQKYHLKRQLCQSSDKHLTQGCMNKAAWWSLDHLFRFLPPQKPWSFAQYQIVWGNFKLTRPQAEPPLPEPHMTDKAGECSGKSWIEQENQGLIISCGGQKGGSRTFLSVLWSCTYLINSSTH